MKKALLVGINAYPGCPLQGCVNDIYNTARLLQEKYGFSQSDIVMLTDAQATTANIIDKLNWLVDVRPGDIVFFHYSGHGAQVSSNDPSERDHLSECMCPVDFDWSPAHMIIDKQLVSIFSRMPQGVVFNWLSDSCHSGDLDREMPAAPMMSTDNFFFRPCNFAMKIWNKLAFWKKSMPKRRSFPMPVCMHATIAKAKANGAATRSLTNGILDVGFVSGCRSDQTSADTYEGGQHCGAATFFFVKNVRDNPSVSLVDLVVKINQDLRNNGYEQQPQAEGNRRNTPFLA